MSQPTWSAFLLGVTLTFSGGAFAQTAPADAVKQAQTKFDAGMAAHKKGRIEEALALFQEASSLHRGAGVLLNIAQCEEELGRIASAWKHNQDALGLLGPKDDRIADTKARIARLEPLVPKLRLHAEKGAPADMSVRLGDREVPFGELEKDIALDPGTYTVRVDAKGCVTRTYEVRIAEGESKAMAVGPGRVEFQEPPVVPPPAQSVAPDSTGVLRPTLLITGGVLAVGLLGSGTGLLVVREEKITSLTSEVQRLRDKYGPSPCGAPVLATAEECRSANDKLNGVTQLRYAAIGMFVAGGVVTAATIGYWLVPRMLGHGSKSGGGTMMVPFATVNEGGAVLRGTF